MRLKILSLILTLLLLFQVVLDSNKISHYAQAVYHKYLNEINKTIRPKNIPLEVVYEDENFAVINKPSGLLTHPTNKERQNTLVNALLYKFGENLSDTEGPEKRGIVHRLDRNTSGLLIIAKNNEAHKELTEQFKKRTITKKYRAILVGNYPKDYDIIDAQITRDPKHWPKQMVTTQGGKPSLTKVKVIERLKDVTFVDITLVTGRTHQIRVHLSSKGYPLYNDFLYGAPQGEVETQHQVLQSYYLKFRKPISNEIIELEIEPDEKINKVLTFYRNRSKQ